MGLLPSVLHRQPGGTDKVKSCELHTNLFLWCTIVGVVLAGRGKAPFHMGPWGIASSCGGAASCHELCTTDPQERRERSARGGRQPPAPAATGRWQLGGGQQRKTRFTDMACQDPPMS